MRTVEEQYQATLDRRTYLERKGYMMQEMWECQLHKKLQVDNFLYK